jgi:hypothetical protein
MKRSRRQAKGDARLLLLVLAVMKSKKFNVGELRTLPVNIETVALITVDPRN